MAINKEPTDEIVEENILMQKKIRRFERNQQRHKVLRERQFGYSVKQKSPVTTKRIKQSIMNCFYS